CTCWSAALALALEAGRPAPAPAAQPASIAAPASASIQRTGSGRGIVDLPCFEPAAELRLPARAVKHLALELAAGGVDVVSTRASHHRQHLAVQQDLLERADILVGAALE